MNPLYFTRFLPILERFISGNCEDLNITDDVINSPYARITTLARIRGMIENQFEDPAKRSLFIGAKPKVYEHPDGSVWLKSYKHKAINKPAQAPAEVKDEVLRFHRKIDQIEISALCLLRHNGLIPSFEFETNLSVHDLGPIIEPFDVGLADLENHKYVIV